eukprot:gnl/Spiro4/3329_TR1624_c0_g1_i1.p1 gnl/Spiro4/3329_TR1624_c0_g1~~gnl/Spiro4/3329_TR1624_c0_g1_i1.p1  ORF type:complete len:294 (-),score=66.49 gnl/Spiro4/3329_TR1624_c0_g1_i1:44-925(-)
MVEEALEVAELADEDTLSDLVTKFIALRPKMDETYECFNEVLGKYKSASVDDGFSIKYKGQTYPTTPGLRLGKVREQLSLAQRAITAKLAELIYPLYRDQKVDNGGGGDCFYYSYLDSYFQNYVSDMDWTSTMRGKAKAPRDSLAYEIGVPSFEASEKLSIAAQRKDFEVSNRIVAEFRKTVGQWLTDNYAGSSLLQIQLRNHQAYTSDIKKLIQRIATPENRVFAETAETQAAAEVFGVPIVLCAYDSQINPDGLNSCDVFLPTTRAIVNDRPPVVIINLIRGVHFVTVKTW